VTPTLKSPDFKKGEKRLHKKNLIMTLPITRKKAKNQK
jgi:hypothetical protein